MLITHNESLHVIYAAVVDSGLIKDTATDTTFFDAYYKMMNFDPTGEEFRRPFLDLANNFFSLGTSMGDRIDREIKALKKAALVELEPIEVSTIQTDGGMSNAISILAGKEEYFSWPETSQLFIIAECAGSILSILHDVKSIAEMLYHVRKNYSDKYEALTIPVMVMKDYKLESGCKKYNPGWSIYYARYDPVFYGRSVHGYNGIMIDPRDKLSPINS